MIGYYINIKIQMITKNIYYIVFKEFITIECFIDKEIDKYQLIVYYWKINEISLICQRSFNYFNV